MSRRLLAGIPLIVALTWGSALAQRSPESLRLTSAETALEFNRHILEDLGIELVFQQPIGEAGEFLRAVFPAVSPVSLRILAPGGSFDGFDDGALRHAGEFEIVWKGGRQSVLGFELVPAADGAWGSPLFELRAADGAVPFLLGDPHPQLLARSADFVFLNMDLLLSEDFARRLGTPQFAGAAIGSADVRTRLDTTFVPVRASCESNVGEDGLDVDVELTGITGLVEVHHTSDRVAMAPAVNLHNRGTSDVEWKRPIFPDGGSDPVINPEIVGPHPFLVMSFYRLADGVMHQIGRADVKHAFFAANTGCACPGAQVLFVGCSDLYQAVTNYNRVNLAPREEVTAATGAWQSSGSHFDGDPVDNRRDHLGEGGSHPDPFEHRLTVASEDLVTAGARYFVEAGYITPGDINIFNSMGRREVAPQLNSVWLFPFVDDGLTQGPALDDWIDRLAPPAGAVATVLDTGEGEVELVSTTTVLPSGAYRYDYGLMNFDFDRRIRSFSVPLPAGVELASVAFYDGNDDPGDDWQSTVTASAIVWSTPAGEPAVGALDWGTLFNFRFDANAAPSGPTATMEVLEAGSPNQLTAASKGPGELLVSVNRLEVVAAGSGLGTVTSSPAGIGCSPDCDELYTPGTPVQLSAVADPGSALIRWTEGGVAVGTGESQDTLLDVDRSLVVVFELCDRQLDAQTIDDTRTFEACDVLRAGAGFVVGATGSATLRAGSGVMLADGFVLRPGGELEIELDPSLLP
jgi:hypothetical protein